MPVTYKLDEAKRILRHYPSGRLTLADVRDVFEKVVDDESIPLGVVEFVYFDGVEEFSFHSDTASEIPKCFQSTGYRKKIVATFFIAQAPLQIGISRMFQSFFNLYAEGHPVCCVKSPEEAEKLAQSFFRAAGNNVMDF